MNQRLIVSSALASVLALGLRRHGPAQDGKGTCEAMKGMTADEVKGGMKK